MRSKLQFAAGKRTVRESSLYLSIAFSRLAITFQKQKQIRLKYSNNYHFIFFPPRKTVVEERFLWKLSTWKVCICSNPLGKWDIEALHEVTTIDIQVKVSLSFHKLLYKQKFMIRKNNFIPEAHVCFWHKERFWNTPRPPHTNSKKEEGLNNKLKDT